MKLEILFNHSKFSEYAAYLKSTNLSDASIDRKLSSLASFQKFLVKKKLIEVQNPPESKSTPTHPLTKGGIKKIFSLPFVKGRNPKGEGFLFKYLAIFTLFAIGVGLGFAIYRQAFTQSKKDLAYSTAAAPVTAGRFLSFQGRLTDSSGNAIESEVGIIFKLYNVGTTGTGTTLYTSESGNSQTVVPDANGIFSVTIGKSHGTTIPSTVFSENAEVWLEITAGGEVMSPRQPIATVAYALNAETLQGLPPSASGLKNTVLVVDGSGDINLGETSPSIISKSGTFGIEGQSVLLTTSAGSGGDITISPDLRGQLDLSFSGSSPTGGGGFVNAQADANLTSGNLFYGKALVVGSTNYNFINFQNYNVGGTVLASRFSVDGFGNTFVGATLTTTNLAVGSSYLVSNLNSDLLDGHHSSDFVGVGITGSFLYTAGNGLNLSGGNQFKLGGALTENTNLTIGNTSAFFIDSTSGKIGVGITAPRTIFDISGSSPKLRLANNIQNAGEVGIEFSHSNYAGTAETKNAIISKATGAFGLGDLHFVVDSAADGNGYTVGTDTKLIIKSATGNVGIGTTNPNYKLEVNGSGLFTTLGVGATDPNYSLYTNGKFGVGSTAYFASYVGIGTTTPQANLDIYGVNSSLRLSGAAGGNKVTISSIDFYNYNSNALNVTASIEAERGDNNYHVGRLIFKTSDTSSNLNENMVLNENGNLGIGNTNPTHNLDVTGDANITTNLSVGGTLTLAQGAGINKVLQSDASGNASWVDSSAIGSTYVAGNGLTLAGGTFKLGGALTENTHLNIGNTEALFIDFATGNIGLGLTNPAYKLQTFGSIAIGASGQFLGLADSAGLPSFSWSADANTGMFRAAADTLGFATAAVERFRIKANGNVVVNNGMSVGGNLSAANIDIASLSVGTSATTGSASLFAMGGASAFTNPNGTTYFYDQFKESVTTLLNNHTPDIGTSWGVLIQTGGVTMQAQATEKADLTSVANSAVLYAAGSTLPTADYEVSITADIADTSDDVLVLGARIQDSTNMYLAQFSGTAAYCSIYKDIGGTWTVLATSDEGVVNGNTLKFRVVGSNLTMYKDNKLIASAVDTDITAPGRAGLGGGAVTVASYDADTTWDLDNFNVIGYNGSIRSAYFGDNCATSNCATSLSMVQMTQTNPYSTGPVLGLTSSSINNNGLSIDIGSSSASNYGLNITSNNGLIQGLSVRGNGFIGLGTTLPTHKLDVIGDGSFSTNLSVGGTVSLTGTNTTGTGTTAIFIDSTGTLTKRVLGSLAFQDVAIGTTYAAGNGLTLSGGTFKLGGALTEATRLNIGSTEVMYFSTAGNIGLGTTSPSEKLEIAGNILLWDSANDNTIRFKDNNVAHGMTSIVPTSVHTELRNESISDGGTRLLGITDQGTTALHLYGIIGSTDPLDGTPAVKINSAKKNTTNVQSLGDLETVFQIQNNTLPLMTILGSANVGIGTTAPGNKLDVNGLTSSNGFVGRYSTALPITTSHGFFSLDANFVDGNNGGLTISSLTADVYQPRMTINHNGYVGIGTTAPVSPLDVVGKIKGSSLFLSTVSAKPAFVMNGSSNYGYIAPINGTTWALSYGGSETTLGTAVLNWNDSGNVGIGTTTPGYKLDVTGNGNFSTNLRVGGTLTLAQGAGINKVLQSDASGNASWVDSSAIGSTYAAGNGLTLSSGTFKLGGALTEATRLNIGSTEVMYFSTAGKVGIGTTSPTNKLDIVGGYLGLSTGQGITWQNGNAAIYESGYGIRFQTWTGAALTEKVRIQGNGNVGIGTSSPTTRLQIGETASYFTQEYASDTGLIVGYGNTTRVQLTRNSTSFGATYSDIGGGGIKLSDGSSNSYIISGSSGSLLLNPVAGNVGIGLTKPLYKLQVAGEIVATKIGIGATSTSAFNVVGNGNFTTNLSVGGTVTLTGTNVGTGTTALFIASNGTITKRALGAGAFMDGIGTTYAASNGLTLASNTFKLGGLLTQNTDIGFSGFSLNFLDGGTTLVTFSSSGNTFYNPTTFTSSGDVSIAYDLNLTNSSGSNINTAGPFAINVGEIFNSSNLTLQTYNAGKIILSSANLWNDGTYFGIGTTNPTHSLDVTGDAAISTNLSVGGTVSLTGTNTTGTGTTAIFIASNGTLTKRVLGSLAFQDTAIGTTYAAGNGLTLSGSTFKLGGALTEATRLNIGSTEVMYFSTSGNVGIGTTSPTVKLEVAGSINLFTGSGRLLFNGGDAAVDESAYNLLFSTWTGTALTEKMRILSGGNVGIGTSTPNYKLEVNGSGLFTTLGIGTTDPNYSLYTNGKFGVGSTAYFASSVGIGTTAPSSKLHISSTSGFTPQITLGNTASYRLDLGYNNTNEYGFLQSYAANTSTYDELVLNPLGGNVGIGTTAPNSALEINKAITFNNIDTFPQFVIKDSAGQLGRQLGFGVDANNFSFIQSLNRGSNYNSLVLQRYGGNVGIGTTTPNYKLEVAGSGLFTTLGVGATDPNYALYTNGKFGVGSTAYFASSVGIGTTAPDSKLHVRGGDLFVEGGTNTRIIVGDSEAGADFGQLQWITASNVLSLTSSNGRPLSLQSSTGNVGIGNTNPLYTFQVGGTGVALIESKLGIGATSASAFNVSTNASIGTNLSIGGTLTMTGTNVGTGTTALFIASNGTVTKRGLGALAFLDVGGTYTAGNGLTLSGSQFKLGGALTEATRLNIGSTEVMYFSTAGNIGLGTTSPTKKLDVNGQVQIRNALFLSNASGNYASLEVPDATGKVEFKTIASYDFQTYTGGTYNSKLFLTSAGNVGIGTTNPTEKLEIAGNLKFNGNAEITGTGDITIGTTATALNFNSSGTVNFAQSLSTGGTLSSFSGLYVGGTQVVDANANISGDRIDEIVTARTTYNTLNDRLNGIVTNYSSVLSNAYLHTVNLTQTTDVNTTTTTAYFNNRIGSIQNDHGAWSRQTPTSWLSGNGAYAMGPVIVNGNYLYTTSWTYGAGIIDLTNNTLYRQYCANAACSGGATLAGNYFNNQALDTDHNVWYISSSNGYGLNKIDIATNTVTAYTTSNSSIASNVIGYSHDNSLQYYNDKIYLFPNSNYMQVFNVGTTTFTTYGAGASVPQVVYSTQKIGNKLHISSSTGFYIWNMDTDTLEKRYYAGGPQGLNSYTNTVYSSIQDLNDSDIVWLATSNSWQKLSKTTGVLEFHRIDSETGLAIGRWTISKIGNQLWFGANSGDVGYLVYDLISQNYFDISDFNKIIGNEEYTGSYHFQITEQYNGNYFIPVYANYVNKSTLVYEATNNFQTNTLIGTTQNMTSAKFNYTGGVGDSNSITWYMSADNGTHWEGPVTPDSLWEFTNPGTSLKIGATMSAGTGTTPIIRSVTVVAYDGATWAGEGSNTVETEVLQARDSSANGIFGSLDLRFEDIETDLSAKADLSHNHDTRYLQLTGGTLSGLLTVNANISANNILPNSNNLYDLGSNALKWKNLNITNIYANGNVGIGTTNPLYQLHTTGVALIGTKLGIGATSAYTFNVVGNGNFTTALNVGTTITTANLYTTGFVGIGTTAPGAKLEIASGIGISLPTPGLIKGSIHINSSGTDNNFSAITFGSNSGGSIVNSGQAGIYVQGSSGYGTKMYFGTTSSHATGSQIRMMINQLGYIGIGTTNPLYELHTSGVALIGTKLGIGATSAYTFNVVGNGNITTNLTVGTTLSVTGKSVLTAGFDSNAASTITNLTIDGTSGIGLNINNTGITSDISLQYGETIDNDVDGTINFSSSNLAIGGTTVISANRLFFAADGTAGDPSYSFTNNLNSGMYSGGTDILRFTTANTDRLTINATGLVGIGTTAGVSKLTVAGGIDVGYVDGSNLLRLSYDTTNSGSFQSYIGGSAAKLILNPLGGNIGIANTNPTEKLDVTGNIKASGVVLGTKFLSIGNTLYGLVANNLAADKNSLSLANTGSIRFNNNDTSGSVSLLPGAASRIQNFDTGLLLAVGTGSTAAGQAITGWDNQLFLKNNGYIGMGTTNPTAHLDIAGVTSLISNSSGDITLNSASNNISFSSDNLTNIANANIGNTLNVGDVLPNSNLNYDLGSSSLRWDNAWIKTLNIGSSTWSFQSPDNSRLSIFNSSTGGTEALTIKSNGSIGIGTTNPLAKLHVYGGSGNGSLIMVGGGTSGKTNLYIATSADSSGYSSLQSISAEGSSYGALVLQKDGGNVGIGTTSPSEKLEVSDGNMKITGASNPYLFIKKTNATSRDWYLQAYNDILGLGAGINSGLSITNTGNVGIGTTGPSYKLDVSGTIRGTGSITGANVISTGNVGFHNDVYYSNVANPIWSFGNATGYGLAYYQGSALSPAGDAIGFHFGSSASPQATINSSGRMDAQSSSGNGGYISSGNFGGTGTAAYFPSGLWANGANSWIYGTVTFNGAVSGMTSLSTSSLRIGGWNITYGTAPGGTGNELIFTQDGGRIIAFDGDGRAFYSNGGNWTVNGNWFSDEKLKTNIVSINSDMDAINSLNAISFNWNQTAKDYLHLSDEETQHDQYGFIAQQVEQIFPGLVSTDEGGYKGINYVGLIPFTIRGLQQVDAKVVKLDKDLSLTATGEINVGYNVSEDVLKSLGYEGTKNEIEAATYSLTDSLGNAVTRISQFAEIASAKIKTGFLSATNIVTKNIVAEKIISPKANIDEITATTATISGTLTTDTLVAKDATISTLYADNIISKEGSFGELMTEKVSSLRDELKKLIATNTASSSAITGTSIMSQSSAWSMDIASDSAKITGDLELTNNLIVGAKLTVNGDTQLGNAFITGTFTTGEIAIKDNLIETTNSALYIQPSNTGSVHIMGDTLVIADTGDVQINGNLKVSGSLMANLITADEIQTNKLTSKEINSDQIKIATDSAQTIIAETGFAAIATSSAKLTSNATAGTATLPAGKTEIIITNNKLTANSMVYLTPVGSTKNQVPYIKSKVINSTESSFTIALDNYLDQDIEINWWIIN